MTALSNQTISTNSRPNKQAGTAWLNYSLAVLLAVVLLPLLGGADGIHAAAGMLMLTGCAIHLYLHRRWTNAVVFRPPSDLAPALRLRRRLFIWTAISGMLCGLSGMAALLFAIGLGHGFLPLHCCGTTVHILSSAAFLGLNIYHMVLHKAWFARISRLLRRQD
jgi:hypothetical protein